jgi:transcriptional regulator with XRE-family HTH domain
MSKNINDEVAKRIKIFIQHLGITTAEFCRKTGLSRQTVDKFKAGIHGPSVESLDKIIKSYPELRLNWLVSGEGMMVQSIPDDEENFLIRMYEMEVKSKNDPRLTMSFVSAVQRFAQEHKELEQLDTKIKVLLYNEGEHGEFRATLLLYQHQRRFISEVLRRTPERPLSLLDPFAPIDKLNDRLETLKRDINEIISLKKGE